jgi:hypothetical protein
LHTIGPIRFLYSFFPFELSLLPMHAAQPLSSLF